ncbi:flagellar biosynthesis protein FlhA [Chromobacterium haemolyticum]|uniref:Flagellar biosynthesis protein FlhA n=1 Tax=Chromobacterium fluminis TaxID=3044269 RepID=A0ABX0L5Y3_9NEIS|nr:flagellar biosynthesis protein FlhA [Chromobacterium haemolyticum]NHR04889.1 flagellar biosynthesis protein FlhA [Chromobacterium haemolyticum]
MSSLLKLFKEGANVSIILLMVGILFVLFTPVSARVLDALLLGNFSLALFVLLLTFYVRKPVDFSTFPSVLLIATLLRLALNVSATRLILSDGDAGRVIGAIGSYVVGGNYVIGVIVFLILVVVQYVVVTSGAQRVAEVAARFTLDSMPGQQMSIDADLNMGFIDQAEAQRRRKELEKEAGFYGAMDGASKFVKGDAIAGIIIMLINIVGGFAVGVAQHGMPWQEALQTYTLLTIGDGIVTQVPALVISVGTGIIITRSASDDRLSSEILGQFTAYPNILLMVAGALALAALLPGLPALPALMLAGLFAGGGLALRRLRGGAEDGGLVDEAAAETEAADASLYDELRVDLLSIELAPDLMPLMGQDGSLLLERIGLFRKQYMLDSGLVLPKVKVRESKSLRDGAYQIRLQGDKAGEGRLEPGAWLAIHPGGERGKLEGTPTTDPAYNLPAIWIQDAQRPRARELGYTVVDAATVFMTHFSEIVKRHSADLLTREEVERLAQHLRQTQASLLDELLPNVMTLSEIQKVLQALLQEKVSIRRMDTILEVLVDAARASKDVDELTTRVRQRLGSVICAPLLDGDGALHVITLDGGIEQTLYDGLRRSEGGAASLALDPRFAEQLLKKMLAESERMAGANHMPVLLCAPEVRANLRKLTARMMPHLHVLALNEVPPGVGLKAFAAVTF